MYSNLAKVYDQLMEDAPYDLWGQFADLIKPKSTCRVLDMGCGTGAISTILSEEGHQVEAFDLSEDMINVANSKESKAHFSQNDVRTFDYQTQFDFIISYCDVLNYLTNEDELQRVFNRVYQHLGQNGVFSFDVHSLQYIDWLIDQEIFSEVREDLSYVWFTEQGEHDGEVYHDLTFFVKERSGLFKRYDERHLQKGFAVEVYKKLLNQAGFKNIEVYEDFNQDPSDRVEDADRIFFVCKRK